MKLLKYNLGILLCLTAIFFIACDSDDETIQQNPKPTIKFTKVGDESSHCLSGHRTLFFC